MVKYLLIFLLLLQGCSTTPDKDSVLLDLTEEKKIIEDSKDLKGNEPLRTQIINTYNRCEKNSQESQAIIDAGKKEKVKLEEALAAEKLSSKKALDGCNEEKAELAYKANVYDWVRNALLIGAALILIWYFRDYIVKGIKFLISLVRPI